MKMKTRKTMLISTFCIIFVLGLICGMELKKTDTEEKIQEYKDEIKVLKQQDEDEKVGVAESEEFEENESEEDFDFVEQRNQYFEEIKPIKFYSIDFYQNHKKYKITSPKKIYKDYNCTKKVKDPVITSTNVAEIIMNEENSRFGLRTEDNRLVWCKEEPRIEEIK